MILLVGIFCVFLHDCHGQIDPKTSFTNIAFSEGGGQRHNLVSRIIQDSRGYIWVPSGSGLYRYDGKDLRAYFHSADTNSISSNHQSSIYEDVHGNIWVGTRGKGLDLYDPVLDRFNRDRDPLRNDLIVWSFYEADSSIMWVGCKDYLVRFDRGANTCEYFDLPANVEHHNAARDIIADPDDPSKLWIGTIFGLMSFDTVIKEFTSYSMPDDFINPAGSGGYLVMDVVKLDATTILGSSWGGGVVVFDPSSGRWLRNNVQPPHTDPNRWHDVILDMEQKSETEVWVASSHGAGIFNMETMKYTFFQSGEDPLLTPSFNYDGICVTRDGHVVFGRYGGFSVSIDPVVPASHAKEPFPPVISSIALDGYPYPTDTAASLLSYIEMDEDAQDIAFTIAQPGHFNGSEIMYEHKLEGYDRTWQATSGNLLRYTNLGQGRYALQVRTSTDGVNWNYIAKPVTLYKAAHIWEMPWFYASLLILVAGVFGMIYWINIRAVRRTASLKTEYDKKIAGIEMAALRAQMNPHFMFNSLSSIKAYILREKTDEASEYLTKFSRLMRAVLRNSKNPLVTLEDELGALKLYVELEALRFEDEFKYEFNVDASIDTSEIVLPPLLIQPYVENAIRHGLLEKEDGLRHLLIEVKPSGEEILVVVQDNGIGREAAARKKPLAPRNKRSLGMEITGDRIALIEQTLGIHANVHVIDITEEGVACGTRVELRVPCIPVSEALK